jgi:hypothetical protein
VKQRKDSDGEMFLRHNNHEAPLGPSPKPMDFQQAGGSSGFGGETFITSTTTTSTVVSIDAVTRTLQLKQSNGKTTAYKAGPEVANFDQIKIGDLVQATVAEELAVDVAPANASLSTSNKMALVRSPNGGPLINVDTRNLTAALVSVDPQECNVVGAQKLKNCNQLQVLPSCHFCSHG